MIPTAKELEVVQAEAELPLAAALAVAIETGLRVGGLPGLTVREDATWHTVSKSHRLPSIEPLSADVCSAVKAARLDPRRPIAAERFSRGPGRLDETTKSSPEELMVAWLKTRLARLCAKLVAERKISAVYSWHDLRHAFAQKNAGRGMTVSGIPA